MISIKRFPCGTQASRLLVNIHYSHLTKLLTNRGYLNLFLETMINGYSLKNKIEKGRFVSKIVRSKRGCGTDFRNFSSLNFYPNKRMNTRRDTFINWLKPNRDRIEFARKGYLPLLFDEYNSDHPEAQLKNKDEMSRWLYYFRRTNGVPIHYCPTKKQKIRSRKEHSNYQEQ